MGLLSTASFPHGKSWLKGLQTASLDHSMWFHNEFKMDEWVLAVIESPVSARGRGFNRGLIYSRDGKLVASVSQEGLMRLSRQ